MFKIKVNWEDAPGVRDAALARAWCRLRLTVNERSVISYLTADGNARDYVYGSALPLARWFVHRYWSLLHESARHERVGLGARALSEPVGRADVRAWTRRHSLLAAREGMALPDLLLFRDGQDVRVVWRPDPPAERARFCGEGDERVSVAQLRLGLSELVNAVLERLVDDTSAEVVELREAWSAVGHSTENERDLCEIVAAVGEDPYETDLSDAQMNDLVSVVHTLPEGVWRDVLDVSDPASLLKNVSVAKEFLAGLDLSGEPIVSAQSFKQIFGEASVGLAPWQVGYARARRVRAELGNALVDCVGSVPELIGACVGPVRMRVVQREAGITPSRSRSVFSGALSSRRGDGHQLALPALAEVDLRFHQVRALHRWLPAASHDGPRLLTRGYSTVEQEGRAFAAELLAPAMGILALQGEGLFDDEIARHYRVNPTVINFQIENQLGQVANLG